MILSCFQSKHSSLCTTMPWSSLGQTQCGVIGGGDDSSVNVHAHSGDGGADAGVVLDSGSVRTVVQYVTRYTFVRYRSTQNEDKSEGVARLVSQAGLTQLSETNASSVAMAQRKHWLVCQSGWGLVG